MSKDNTNINLLPLWYKNKLQLEAFIKKTAIILVVIFLSAMFAVIYLEFTISAYESELKRIQNEINREEFEFSDRVFFELMEARNFVWAYESPSLKHYLGKVFSAMPYNIRAVEINYSASEFIFRGMAECMDSIPVFVRGLTALDFADVSMTRLDIGADGQSSFTFMFGRLSNE